MQLASNYFFEGLPRLSYGWDNPNYAGTVLAALIPICWMTELILRERGARRWLPVSWGAELGLMVMLGLTYSRGGMVAWLASIMFFGAFGLRRIRGVSRPIGHVWLFWFPRLALAAAVLLASGALRRFVAVAEGDASAGNRLTLWHGGLELIDASPAVGWGRGNSGLAFMQWVQDPGRSELYSGMLNMYLHAAVEFGLPIFGLFMFVLSFPIAAVLCIRPAARVRTNAILHACAASLIAFAVAGVFGSFWIIPSIVWLPILAAGVIVYVMEGRGREWAVAAGVATSVSIAFGIALYSAAVVAGKNASWRLHRTAAGAVQFTARGAAPTPAALCFLPDGRILGQLFGKEIRGAIATTGSTEIGRFTIYPPQIKPPREHGGKVVVFGARVREIGPGTCDDICAVFPVGSPHESAGCEPRIVILPECDEIGFVPLWRAWCRERERSAWVISDAGQDIRREWPRIFAAVLSWTNTAAVQQTRSAAAL